MKLHSGCCSGLKVGRGDVQGVTHCDLALFFALFPLRLLGKPSRGKSEVFLNIVQKAFDPPPLLFEHLSYFAGGVF